MARNQVSISNKFFNIFMFFNVSSELNLKFLDFNIVQCIESNFIHVKNIIYFYKKKKEVLNFYSSNIKPNF